VEYSHPAWLRFWVSAASHRGGTGAEDAVLGHVHSSLGPGDLALEEPRGMGETGALLSTGEPLSSSPSKAWNSPWLVPLGAGCT
jgi:hypothetical protein